MSSLGVSGTVVEMKPQETQLISELSELQSMVSELKVGFSSALLELRHIQQEDARLREDLEQTKQHCDRETLQLRALVDSLKTDLQEVRSQICQLHKDQQKSLQSDRGKVSGATETQRNSCTYQACGGSQIDGIAPPLSQPASLLLHCYLQGLRAGLCPVTESPVTTQALPRLAGAPPLLLTPCNSNVLQDPSIEGQRQQVVSDLFHSEQEYLSTLLQLCDKYKMLSALPKTQGTCQVLVNYLEQLSQHSLLFRNALEDRLHSKQWQGLVGDVFARLTCQNEGTFMGIYLGYVRTLPIVLSHFHQSNGIMHSPQDSLLEREALEVSQLLTPVSRIHSYLTHMQDLLQWTSRDHPDHYLLQVSKTTLRDFLSQCHVILEHGGLQGDREKAKCSSAAPPFYGLPISCQHNTGSTALTPSEHCEPASATNRSEPDKNSHSANGFPASNYCPNANGSVRSRGPGRVSIQFPPVHHLPGACCHGDGRVCRGGADPGGGERGSGPAQAPPPSVGARGPGAHNTGGNFEDCDTDLDELGDASVFDYSSVTSCSPDGTLEMRERDAREGGLADEDEDEEDSQVPVLLKPRGEGTQPAGRVVPAEGSACLGVPSLRTHPHPPPGKPRTTAAGPPGPGATWGSARSPSNRQPPSRPFRPACPASSMQRETTSREYKMARGTIENPRKLDRGGLRSVLGVAFGRAWRSSPQETGNTGVWEDSEDSDGPCSTV